MNTALWVVQGFLAAIFLITGGIKFVGSREILHEKLPAVRNFTISVIRSLGLVEILGGLGLILPGITEIAVKLTPAAATGLSAILLPATAIHLKKKEPKETAVVLVLLAMTMFVAWGRLGSYPL